MWRVPYHSYGCLFILKSMLFPREEHNRNIQVSIDFLKLKSKLLQFLRKFEFCQVPS